jgi:hypothetical protein
MHGRENPHREGGFPAFRPDEMTDEMLREMSVRRAPLDPGATTGAAAAQPSPSAGSHPAASIACMPRTPPERNTRQIPGALCRKLWRRFDEFADRVPDDRGTGAAAFPLAKENHCCE